MLSLNMQVILSSSKKFSLAFFRVPITDYASIGNETSWLLFCWFRDTVNLHDNISVVSSSMAV